MFCGLQVLKVSLSAPLENSWHFTQQQGHWLSLWYKIIYKHQHKLSNTQTWCDAQATVKITKKLHKVDRRINVQLSSALSVCGCSLYFFAVVCALCSLTCNYEVKYGIVAWEKTFYDRAPVIFLLLSLQICGSSRCCGLSGQCLDSSDTQSFSCLRLSVSLLVKSPQAKRKPQRQFVKVEAKFLGISIRLWASITATAYQFVVVKSGTKMLMYKSTGAYQYAWQNVST